MIIPDSQSISVAQSRQRRTMAFSLLEVMIAMGILFVALFGILGIVSQNLKAARSLNQMGPTSGMVAAEMSMTNKLYEGSESGDFGELYPDHSWVRETTIITNGLFAVEIAVLKQSEVESTLNLILFRPESTGGATGPGAGTGTRDR